MHADERRSEPNAEQLEIIRHSLGLNYKKKAYRNYYCAANGDTDLEALVEMGLMTRGRAINDGSDRYYYVTDSGAASVGATLPKD